MSISLETKQSGKEQMLDLEGQSSTTRSSSLQLPLFVQVRNACLQHRKYSESHQQHHMEDVSVVTVPPEN